MKIIDNKKDYYDYLQGVYGIDEKFVFDRRGSTNSQMFIKRTIYRTWDDFESLIIDAHLKIGDKTYTFFHKDGVWTCPPSYPLRWWSNSETIPNPHKYGEDEKGLEFDKYKDSPTFLAITIKTTSKWNPRYTYYIDNPILGTFSFITKLISPEIVWQLLYDHFSSSYDKDIIDNRTDIQKLESAGFDKKTSFRKM